MQVNLRNIMLMFSCCINLFFACTTTSRIGNAYEGASQKLASTFRRSSLPLAPGTSFLVSQGAFGKASHSEPGNEYNWDFDVPVGTPVVAVDDGTVSQIYEPNKGYKCDPSFSDLAHNIKILHGDGTVAQYVHVTSTRGCAAGHF